MTEEKIDKLLRQVTWGSFVLFLLLALLSVETILSKPDNNARHNVEDLNRGNL